MLDWLFGWAECEGWERQERAEVVGSDWKVGDGCFGAGLPMVVVLGWGVGVGELTGDVRNTRYFWINWFQTRGFILSTSPRASVACNGAEPLKKGGLRTRTTRRYWPRHASGLCSLDRLNGTIGVILGVCRPARKKCILKIFRQRLLGVASVWRRRWHPVICIAFMRDLTTSGGIPISRIVTPSRGCCGRSSPVESVLRTRLCIVIRNLEHLATGRSI